MATRRSQGWLLLADISGYTAYLTGTELEHAHEILAELMRGLLGAMQRPLRAVKMEGDAVLAYALAGEVADPRALIGRIEDAYHGFRMQLFNIERSSSCTCSACRSATSLDLKFMLHFGEFVVHDLVGHDDLQGSDVILVHRLLKNDVVERHSKRAYLLATDAARGRIEGLSWTDHSESYEHIGAVQCGVRWLQEAFARLQESGAADVTPDEADATAAFEVAAPPSVVWRWHVDEDKAPKWQGGLDGWQIHANSEGRVQPGATVHCQHGKNTKTMVVLGWRPPVAMTCDSPPFGGMPRFRFTMHVEPLDGGAKSRVEWRFHLTERTFLNRIKMWVLSVAIPGMVRKSAARLTELLANPAPPEQPA